MYRLVVGFLSICIVSIFSVSAVQAATIQLEGSAELYNSNGKLHFTDFNSNVSLNTSTGFLSGYAWLDDLGWLAFGETDNNQGPVTVNMETGVVAGVAKIINTGTYLDFAANGSNVVMDTTTGEFSGYVFEDNLGWIHFGFPGVATAMALPTPTSSPTPTPSSTPLTLTVDSNHKFAAGEKVVLTGTAPANAKVQVEVHSTPQTGTVTANAEGKWAWTPAEELEAGEHYYIARIDNEDGTFGEWSERRYFTVLGEQTVLDNLPVTGAVVGGVAMVGYLLVGTGIGAQFLGRKNNDRRYLRRKTTRN